MDRAQLAVLGELVTFAGNQHAWHRGVVQGIYMSILEVSNQVAHVKYRRGSTAGENPLKDARTARIENGECFEESSTGHIPASSTVFSSLSGWVASYRSNTPSTIGAIQSLPVLGHTMFRSWSKVTCFRSISNNRTM